MATSAVLDASLLLTLGSASALHLLWDNPRCEWHITPIVRSEVMSEPTRSDISKALVRGDARSTELDTDSDEELSALARWSNVVDAGEAEALAIATTRGWVVGLEDRFAQRRVTEALGAEHWINSATLLIQAVEDERLSESEADAIFRRLDCYPGYQKQGIVTISDLR